MFLKRYAIININNIIIDNNNITVIMITIR